MRPAISYTSTNDYRKWFLFMPLTLLVIIVNISLGGAQPLTGNISIEEGGQLWIEGSAGPVDYQCRAEELSGTGEIENTQNPQATVQGDGTVRIAVTLPVKALDCGKRAMNKDMYEALKASKFPNIRYQLLEANLAAKNDSTSSWMNIRTRGIMEIAGVQDTTTIFVSGKLLSDQRFQVKGSKPIHMDTYNIDPPSAMLGLIRAKKELSVHFDVTVQLQEQNR